MVLRGDGRLPRWIRLYSRQARTNTCSHYYCIRCHRSPSPNTRRYTTGEAWNTAMHELFLSPADGDGTDMPAGTSCVESPTYEEMSDAWKVMVSQQTWRLGPFIRKGRCPFLRLALKQKEMRNSRQQVPAKMCHISPLLRVWRPPWINAGHRLSPGEILCFCTLQLGSPLS